MENKLTERIELEKDKNVELKIDLDDAEQVIGKFFGSNL